MVGCISGMGECRTVSGLMIQVDLYQSKNV